MISRTFRTAVLPSALASLALCSAAHAQAWRASCDNRQGGAYADVVDSSDPNQFNYNVDPSEIYRTFSAVNQTVTQTVGNNSATASVSINSRFVGNNPANVTSGFIMDNIVSAQATRSNTNVRAFANDSTQVCMTLSGASAGSPKKMRLLGAIVNMGSAGATFQLRIQNPNGSDLFNQSTAGSFNRLFNLTTNGEYRFTATMNTGDLQPTGGTLGPRGANIYASFVCAADYNGDGVLQVQDIFAMINDWFAGSLNADTDASGNLSVQDIFSYLNLWFAGC